MKRTGHCKRTNYTPPCLEEHCTAKGWSGRRQIDKMTKEERLAQANEERMRTVAEYRANLNRQA